ncbi:MAG: glutamyl-tRNA reductase [Pseudonocardiaceae bacterium]|nr:glutamyl-tRNA reductase [Pseudonocardiaceae bacterium]
MNLLVVGLSHRTAPVRDLERAAVRAEETGKLLDELLGGDHVGEAMLVSTCNRVEVYAMVATFHGGLADVSGVLARHAGAGLEEFSSRLYVHYAAAGVEHLFSVASGLDSMVVGEPQILGQLRAAYAAAEHAGTVGSTLHELAQRALRVGKRVHTETGIATAGASVVSEALADAAGALGELAGRTALVIGAGSMGGLAAARLRRAGIAEIVIANRTVAAAQRLAEASVAEGTRARATALEGIDQALADADVVVSCTGAVGTVLGAQQLAGARRRRAEPLAVCDLGLPRDVEAGVAEQPGVTVVDLETLQHRLQTAAVGVDTGIAQRIVAEEVSGYLSAQRTAEVTPTVTALRKRAAEVVDAEMLRLDGKLPGLDAAVRDELDRTVRRVVDKLLHTPTVRVKQLAGSDGETYADALRELFELDPQAAAAVAATTYTTTYTTAEPDEEADQR